MSRCKCCNRQLTNGEMTRKDPITDEYQELCGACGYVSDLTIADCFIDYPEYAFSADTERVLPTDGMTKPKMVRDSD